MKSLPQFSTNTSLPQQQQQHQHQQQQQGKRELEAEEDKQQSKTKTCNSKPTRRLRQWRFHRKKPPSETQTEIIRVLWAGAALGVKQFRAGGGESTPTGAWLTATCQTRISCSPL
eukprot:1148764-Pelagomonas_calceolata.AAC.2